MKKLKDEIEQLNNNKSETMIKMITFEDRDKNYHRKHLNGATKECPSIIGVFNKGPLKCDQCNHRYDTNSALTKNAETGHKVPDFFQCKVCKSCFDTKMPFKKHTSTKYLLGHPRRGGLYRSAMSSVVCGHSLRLGMSG